MSNLPVDPALVEAAQAGGPEAAAVRHAALAAEIERANRLYYLDDAPELSDAEKDLVMHATVEILAGHVLMATDMLESMGHSLVVGNNTTINLEPDSREEAERLYAALSEGSTDCFALQDMPWGLWGTCLDRYNVRWMFNVASEAAADG